MMTRTTYVTLAVIAAVLLGVGGYTGYQEFMTPTSPSQEQPQNPAPSPAASDEAPTITDNERTQGWYWGTSDQKKPGTPKDWIYSDAGRNSCWHKPDVACTDTSYTCPVGGWENCMPILTPEAQKQCTKEAIEWKKKYCPGFQGAAL